MSKKTPQTIEELLAFCERHELPLSKMRFFIGLDYPGAKAYGIFKDKNGDFVVYKNKADGSRAVRYRGPDEAYAVNELFQKLKDEASGQRARVAAARTPGYPASSAHGNNPYNHPNETRASRRPRKRKSNALLIGIIAAAAAITIGRTAAAIHNNTQQDPQQHAAGPALLAGLLSVQRQLLLQLQRRLVSLQQRHRDLVSDLHRRRRADGQLLRLLHVLFL